MNKLNNWIRSIIYTRFSTICWISNEITHKQWIERSEYMPILGPVTLKHFFIYLIVSKTFENEKIRYFRGIISTPESWDKQIKHMSLVYLMFYKTYPKRIKISQGYFFISSICSHISRFLFITLNIDILFKSFFPLSLFNFNF